MLPKFKPKHHKCFASREAAAKRKRRLTGAASTLTSRRETSVAESGPNREAEMLQSVHPKSATQNQIELLEHALRQLTGISQSGWRDIPQHLHAAFAKYMNKDVWTGESDPLTLSEASLMIVRDAIARTGEFADDEA
jgi:hypothetical protein